MTLSQPDGEPESATYINANYVLGAAGEPRRYIAAMGPLPDTVVSIPISLGRSDVGVGVLCRWTEMVYWVQQFGALRFRYGECSLSFLISEGSL